VARVWSRAVVNAVFGYVVALGALAAFLTFARTLMMSQRSKVIQDAENTKAIRENTIAVAALTATVNSNVLPRLAALEGSGRRGH
jgi:hypothetical protein